MHAAGPRHLVGLCQIAPAARGNHVAPHGSAAARARDNMVKSQILDRKPATTVLAGEPVAQKDIEPGEGRAAGHRHVFLERDDAWQADLMARGTYNTIVFRNDINPLKKRCLDRVLPLPKGQREVAERPVIGVQHKRGAGLKRYRQAVSLLPCRVKFANPKTFRESGTTCCSTSCQSLASAQSHKQPADKPGTLANPLQAGLAPDAGRARVSPPPSKAGP